VADPLELLADIQFGGVEVDLIPGDAQDFSPAEPEDEDQDEGSVEFFAGMPDRFQEPPGVVNGPGLRRSFGVRRVVVALILLTGLRPIISSSTAQVSAARSASRASLRLRAESVSRQQFPTAQQRFLFSGRAASFPWAQHWQVTASLLSHCLMSFT
jgi:hypothetical protein